MFNTVVKLWISVRYGVQALDKVINMVLKLLIKCFSFLTAWEWPELDYPDCLNGRVPRLPKW